jgi:hypothetical protein
MTLHHPEPVEVRRTAGEQRSDRERSMDPGDASRWIDRPLTERPDLSWEGAPSPVTDAWRARTDPQAVRVRYGAVNRRSLQVLVAGIALVVCAVLGVLIARM